MANATETPPKVNVHMKRHTNQFKSLIRPASCWMMMENFHQWLLLPHEKCFSDNDHRGRHQEKQENSTKSTIILYRKYTKKKKPKTLIKYEKVKIHFSITVPIYHNQNEQNLMNKYF